MLDDHDLLLGILAVREDFIDVDTLALAFARCNEDATVSLRSVLVAGGSMNEQHLKLLEGLVDEQRGLPPADSIHMETPAELFNSVREALDRAGGVELSEHLLKTLPCPTKESNRRGTPAVRDHGRVRFDIVSHHAKGGLGEVFLATDTEISRKVALKRIRQELQHNESLRTRFFQEAEITGRLEHPGIVPVYALGTDEEGNPYYAMRFIRGKSLDVAIDAFHQSETASVDFDSVAFRSLLSRLIDVCDAVGYAHSRGVIHRDIKPHNIMLGRFGETLVVDWGLARTFFGAEQIDLAESLLVPDSASDSSPTMVGSAIGTPSYMSPEQAAGKIEDVGPASDIYSLGATLYHVLTGQPPRTGDDIDQVIENAVENKHPAVREVKPQAPAALEAVCAKAMGLKPHQRYRYAKQLATDIEQFLADEPVSVYTEPAMQRLNRWLQHHRTFVSAGLVATLVLAIAAAVGSLFLRRSDQREFQHRIELQQREHRRLLEVQSTAEAIEQADSTSP